MMLTISLNMYLSYKTAQFGNYLAGHIGAALINIPLSLRFNRYFTSLSDELSYMGKLLLAYTIPLLLVGTIFSLFYSVIESIKIFPSLLQGRSVISANMPNTLDDIIKVFTTHMLVQRGFSIATSICMGLIMSVYFYFEEDIQDFSYSEDIRRLLRIPISRTY